MTKPSSDCLLSAVVPESADGNPQFMLVPLAKSSGHSALLFICNILIHATNRQANPKKYDSSIIVLAYLFTLKVVPYLTSEEINMLCGWFIFSQIFLKVTKSNKNVTLNGIPICNKGAIEETILNVWSHNMVLSLQQISRRQLRIINWESQFVRRKQIQFVTSLLFLKSNTSWLLPA